MRIGWITSDSFAGRKRRFEDLEEVNAMRAGSDYDTPPLASATSGPARIREYLTGLGAQP